MTVLTTSLIYFSDYGYVFGVFGTESIIKIHQENKEIFDILNLDCMNLESAYLLIYWFGNEIHR